MQPSKPLNQDLRRARTESTSPATRTGTVGHKTRKNYSKNQPMKISTRGMAIAALPTLLMLLLFYSLAFHMHRALHGWPTSIGERGFPEPLVTHCSIQTSYCIV